MYFLCKKNCMKIVSTNTNFYVFSFHRTIKDHPSQRLAKHPRDLCKLLPKKCNLRCEGKKF